MMKVIFLLENLKTVFFQGYFYQIELRGLATELGANFRPDGPCQSYCQDCLGHGL